MSLLHQWIVMIYRDRGAGHFAECVKEIVNLIQALKLKFGT